MNSEHTLLITAKSPGNHEMLALQCKFATEQYVQLKCNVLQPPSLKFDVIFAEVYSYCSNVEYMTYLYNNVNINLELCNMSLLLSEVVYL